MTVGELVLAVDGFLQNKIDLPIGTVFIGRAPNRENTLADPQVSWRHTCITSSADTCMLEDLNSTNGT